jgi:hypothetical protein
MNRWILSGVVKKVIAVSLFIALNLDFMRVANARQLLNPVRLITISGPTKVTAGKYITVKLTTKEEVSSICSANHSEGFADSANFFITKKKATLKLLAIKPGAGLISIHCGPNYWAQNEDPHFFDGQFELYIKA